MVRSDASTVVVNDVEVDRRISCRNPRRRRLDGVLLTRDADSVYVLGVAEQLVVRAADGQFVVAVHEPGRNRLAARPRDTRHVIPCVGTDRQSRLRRRTPGERPSNRSRGEHHRDEGRGNCHDRSARCRRSPRNPIRHPACGDLRLHDSTSRSDFHRWGMSGVAQRDDERAGLVRCCVDVGVDEAGTGVHLGAVATRCTP